MSTPSSTCAATTLEKGATPNKGAEVLENLIATDNPGGFAPGGRLNWAADLNLPLLSDKGSCEVLFWVGDGAFDMRNQRTLRAFVKVLKAAGWTLRYWPGRTRQR